MARWRIVFGVLCMALTSTVYSAEAADPKATPPEAAADKPADTSTATSPSTTKDSTDTTKKTEEFIPSEEISEDFAVSFPVDI